MNDICSDIEIEYKNTEIHSKGYWQAERILLHYSSLGLCEYE